MKKLVLFMAAAVAVAFASCGAKEAEAAAEEEAAHAYDLAAKRYHGNKAILNFHNDESRNRI